MLPALLRIYKEPNRLEEIATARRRQYNRRAAFHAYRLKW